MVAFYTCLWYFMISLHACLIPPPGLQPASETANTTFATAPRRATPSSRPASDCFLGRRGPKSPGKVSAPRPQDTRTSLADARVTAQAAGAVGADSQVQPDSASGPAKIGSGASTPLRIRVAKRAYRRACRRALASPEGTTFYRGRLCTAASLGCRPSLQNSPAPAQRRGRAYHQAAGQRLRVCSFNVGGFCTASYDTFTAWLQTHGHRFDLLLLQETHFGLGKTPSEYTLPGWCVISSPDPSHRWAGVAMLVSKRIVAEASLQHCVVVPGRLLHVRFPVGRDRQARHVDVACCYQWAWDADPLKKRIDKRQAYWRKFTTFVQGLPARNIKCIAGDFNCALRPQTRHTGPGLHPTDFTYPDSTDFGQAIVSANLCALNTWGSAREAFTYRLEGQVPKSSQIDFIFASLPHTDMQARRARVDRDINFAPWRGGGRHFAVTTSLRVDTRLAPTHTASAQRPLPFSRQLLREAIKRKDPALERLAHAVNLELSHAKPTNPEEVNAILLRRCAAYFPLQPCTHKPRPGQSQEVRCTVSSMWVAYRQFKIAKAWNPALTRLQNTLAILRAHARFQKAHRELRKRGLEKRKTAILEELEAAEAAANVGDMHKLYFHIRKLSPKAPRDKIHIRTSDGKLLSPQAEQEAILEHFTKVFSRDAANPHITCCLQQPCPLSLDELLKAMQQQRGGRAIPPGSAPAELWKYLAPTLAPHVLPLINNYLDPGPLIFPSLWTDCWLKPLPKPTKPPNSAANLRPIALQDPLGKCIARTLKTRIQAEILAKLANTPQFAYLPSRSTACAISRAARFCAHIRSKLSSSRIEVRDRKAGKTRAPITGGALLSLDMSKAFDYVPHEYLARALQHLGIAQDTINIVLALHRTQYHVTHKGHTGYIHLRNGIRQGCTLSPTLWVCVSHFLLHQLSERLAKFSHLGSPEPWISQAITAFADDFLVSFDLNSHQDLVNVCTRIGCLFTVLGEAKMQVNPDKSSLLIRSSGSALARWVKARTFKRKDQKLIRLGTPFQPIDVGLATRIPYLGTVMSFDSFETQTADLRIQQAKAAVARLSRVLFKKHGLGLQHRLRVYRTCIRSSISYGLAVVGTTPQALRRLASLEARHVRCISGNPRKEDGESAEVIFQRLHYTSISDFLVNASKRRVDALTSCRDTYPGIAEDIQWQKAVHQSYLHPVLTVQSHKPAHPEQRSFQCPQCPRTFESMHAMRTHCARTRK